MNTRDLIARANSVRPSVIREEITIFGLVIPVVFRRLPYIEIDKLRLVAFGPAGFDPTKQAGANARTIAAMIWDESTGSLMYTPEEVEQWDSITVAKFTEVCSRINNDQADAVKVVAGNSEPTDAAAVS